MMGGEIAEAAPRLRRNHGLGFCQARTAARLRKVGNEPQDERFNAPALRPAWEGVRELGAASVTATARAAPGREGLDLWATVQIPGVGADETAVGGVEALSGLFPGGVGEKPGR